MIDPFLKTNSAYLLITFGCKVQIESEGRIVSVMGYVIGSPQKINLSPLALIFYNVSNVCKT